MAEKNENEAKSKPKLHPLVAKLLWPLVIIGAAGFAWFAYVEVQRAHTRVTTDNAEVKSLVVKIFSPEQGYVMAVEAQENDLVKIDQSLVKLDNSYYQWEVERAQANFDLVQSKLGTNSQPGLNAAQLQSAQANVQLINAQLSEAQANLNEAQDQVKDLEAKKDKPGFVQSQLTKAQNNVETWQASVNTLQKQSLFSQKQLAEQQANQRLSGYNLDQAKAELEQARLRLNNTDIRSPIEGYVAQNNISPGVLVQSNQYLMAVISKSDTWITANIKESKIEQIQVDYPVIISLDAFSGETFYGEVESISPAAGSEFALIPRNNASGNFIKTEALIPVRIRILDPKQKARMLPGMSATVTIMTDPLDENDKQVVAYRKAKAAIEAGEKKNKSATPAPEGSHSPTSQAAGTAPAPTGTEAKKADAAADTASQDTSAKKPVDPAKTDTSAAPAQNTPATDSSSTTVPTPPPAATQAPGTGSDNQSPTDTAPVEASATAPASTDVATTASAVQDVAERNNPGSVGTDGR
ncbi:MAG: efflux RND transporter periplasmic adaptor subunit [Puniceicoccales bacterium]